MSMAEDEILIGDGIGPEGKAATFYAAKEVLYALEDFGPQWKYEDCRFMIEAVANPDSIFAVRGRIDDDEVFCYSVRPTYDPDEPAVETLPRYGYAFVVYLKRIGEEYLAYDWDWREEDGDSPGHPAERAEFWRQLWPQT
jgi:hypothetical protein